MSRNNKHIIEDQGAKPLVTNINCLAKKNPYYRTTLWTGNHLQVTLMSIATEIGLEMHSNLDQFIRIEEGCALVTMGQSKDILDYQQKASSSDAVIIPAGTWHNIINIGKKPLKLYSVYSPVQHPFGTIHKTKADADAEEHH